MDSSMPTVGASQTSCSDEAESIYPRSSSPIPPPRSPTKLLRPAIYHSDPLFLYDIFQTIEYSKGLTNQERLVLHGVLPNLPSSTRNSLARRILGLTVDQLRLLASLYDQGLNAAKSLAVQPMTTTGAVSDAVPGPSRGKRSHVDVSLISTKRRKPTIAEPKNNIPVKEKHGEHGEHGIQLPKGREEQQSSQTNPFGSATPAGLLRSLGISQALPGGDNLYPSPNFTHQGSLRKDCLSRQRNTCPITGRMNKTYTLETTHLVPHAIENATSASYWSFLTLCLGTALTSRIYDIISGPNSSLANGISLDLSVHHLFKRGTIYFIPHLPDRHFDPITTRYYDLEFRWRATIASLVGLNTQLPRLPGLQVDKSVRNYKLMTTMRPISIGDRFRVFTRDPVRYPLPHPLLISLHAMLWDMIASIGLGEDGVTTHSTVASTGGTTNDGEILKRGRRNPSHELKPPSNSRPDKSKNPLARPNSYHFDQYYRQSGTSDANTERRNSRRPPSSPELPPAFPRNNEYRPELLLRKRSEAQRYAKKKFRDVVQDEEADAGGWVQPKVPPRFCRRMTMIPESRYPALLKEEEGDEVGEQAEGWEWQGSRVSPEVMLWGLHINSRALGPHGGNSEEEEYDAEEEYDDDEEYDAEEEEECDDDEEYDAEEEEEETL
ncbi:hypothetical protein Q9L58_009906 [Maublancomyces gigas]|uniref:HNH nuclease domain-containing protein n=1 Tax=Discina gigas TaxID=1032678 RepID=A0ABR3G5P6_9PEZI